MTKTQQPELPALQAILEQIRAALNPPGRFKPTPGEWVADAHEGWAHPMTEVRTEESRDEGGHSIVRVRADFNCTVGKSEYEWANAAFVAACSPQNMRAVLAYIEQLERAQAAVLADRESRKVVAWRYMPSPTWGEYVITQDPKVAEVARSMGVEVEALTVKAPSKVEDKTP